ncbi:MAG: HDOD domain-containing protein [Planctomycetota bacterium]
MSHENDSIRAQRIDMILQEVESLPTLSPIATRLLQLSVDDDVEISDIVSLVEADPALTGKLLSMCRYRDRAASQQVGTVERAIVLLGIDAVRSALLSVHVFELLEESPGASLDDGPDHEHQLNRVELWRHLLATACASEMLARENRNLLGSHSPDEAFTAGLLHDLGKIALDMILPRTYGKIAHASVAHRGSVAELERKLIGVDHHRAGKRLAQHWGLPHALMDVVWLHNQPLESIPDLEHKGLIAIVSMADAIARKLHIGWSGSDAGDIPLDNIARSYGISLESVDIVERTLFEAVGRRVEELGLDSVIESELQMRSLAAANRSLSALNATLQRQSEQYHERGAVLGAINTFLRDSSNSQHMSDVFAGVVRSMTSILGEGNCCTIYQRRSHSPWEIFNFSSDGKRVQSELIDPPTDLASASSLDELQRWSPKLLSKAPWLSTWLKSDNRFGPVRFVNLSVPGNSPVLLLSAPSEHHAPCNPALFEVLSHVWASSIASAAQHEGAIRLGEELAESNRVLSETQHDLAEARSMIKLSTLAAGAAHEMNNPLTIISGRCQVLRRKLKDDEDASASVETIHEASCRLTDLISALHVFADPPSPERKTVDLNDLLMRTVRDLKLERHSRNLACPPCRVVFEDRVPPVWVDPEQVATATKELLKNAMESETEEIIRVRVHLPEDDDRLTLIVEDTGKGMRDDVLRKAFDPFFSDKEAGRQPGLGLAVARRLIELHGGTISLASNPDKGTQARVELAGVRKQRGAVGASQEQTEPRAA